MSAMKVSIAESKLPASIDEKYCNHLKLTLDGLTVGKILCLIRSLNAQVDVGNPVAEDLAIVLKRAAAKHPMFKDIRDCQILSEKN